MTDTPIFQQPLHGWDKALEAEYAAGFAEAIRLAVDYHKQAVAVIRRGLMTVPAEEKRADAEHAMVIHTVSAGIIEALTPPQAPVAKEGSCP